MPAPVEHQEKMASRFSFGLFEAEGESGELRRSGIRIRLQAQPFRVLICLLERPGEVVTREEIQQRLWGDDTIVDFDHSLGTAINKLREALGDSAENPRFIETLARRGYRFIAPVTVVEPRHEDRFAHPAESDPASLSTVELAARSPATVAPPKKTPLRFTMITVVAVFLIAAGFLAGSRMRTTSPAPPLISQVTFSGRVSPADPLFESFPGTATDGSRIYFPQIENGRGVLAQALVADGETSTLPLPDELAAPSLGDISPDGSRLLLRNHLATAPEQALWIVSTTGGTARKVPGVLAHDATWMPDGQRILFAIGDDLVIAHDNGTESRRFATLPGRAFWLRWSPDGKRLRLTLLNSETHTTALWQVNSDGADAHPLELDNWNGSPPAECCGSWTDDGRYYVFQSSRGANSNIWARHESTGFLGLHNPLIPITNGPVDYQAPITERGSKRTFFIGLDTQSALLRYDAAGQIFVPLGTALNNARRVEFTHDGGWVAWIRHDDRSLWRSRPDGSELLQLTARPLQVFTMHWSHDGRELVFMGRQPGKPWKIYTMDADGGHLQEVLDETRSEADPDWSPDGKMLVFGRLPDLMAEASQPKAIYRIDLATKATTKLVGSDGLFSPRWSADGKYIAALSIDQKKLMLYDVAAKTWRPLSEGNIADPSWSHDDSAIFFHDFAQADQPIYKVVIKSSKVERVADFHDLRSANIVDYRFAGLAPNDVPLVSARMSAANIYAAELPH
ncbi:MAG TPA: winged helix-turn-helix domain-containing protein [Acidobacteriaceae bacterium]|jgi:Tol biopolymer transport system component/DNA-binding winged helix-turn-helix (wHTH) protein